MTTATEPSPPPAGRSRLWGRVRPLLLVTALALGVALGLRLFVAEAFRIPTASMEENLRVGDFLLVSKLHYGPRTPATLGLPFSERYLAGVTLPSLRLPGFAHVERGDVVVFNHPSERGPVERRTPYIKRVAGLPGDTVSITGKELRVGAEHTPLGPGMLADWLVTVDAQPAFSLDRFGEAGVRHRPVREAEGLWRVRMTLGQAEAVAAWDAVLDLRPAIAEKDPLLFPAGTQQSLDAYGPVAVPKRGQTVQLDGATWPVLRDVIERHEGHTARRLADGRFEIDGEIVTAYTPEQDYYFVLGDNRDDSSDSRRWGFVPRDHLVGKAVLVYFSWDDEEGSPRFERIGRAIR
ncbi:MAG: signal peptidase I [Bacteroidota bacterium]